MKFKNISIILTFFSFNWKVKSAAIIENEISSESVEFSMDEATDSSIEYIDTDIDLVVEDIASEEEITGSIKYEECLTPDCYEISKRILTNMDISADPCEDFYQFTCGGWMNENDIPKSRKNYNNFTKVYYENMKSIIEILEGDYKINNNLSEIDQDYDKRTFNKLKNLYNTCLNYKETDESIIEAFKYLLTNLEINENKKNFKNINDFTNLVNKLHNYGFPYLFLLRVYYQKDNEDENLIMINNVDIGMDKIYYENTDYISIYKDEIKQILNLFKDSDEDINIMVDSIFEFEKQLNSIYYSINNESNIIKTTIKDLNENYNFINWKTYFKNMFETFGINKDIDDNFVIVNSAPEYLKKLNNFINEADPVTLLYYAKWISINSLIYYQSYIPKIVQDELKRPSFRQNETKFSSNLNIKKSYHNIISHFNSETDEIQNDDEIPRSEYCYNFVNLSMKMAIGKLFVEKYYPEGIENDIKEKIEYFKEAMVNRISQISWIDDQTKQYAIKKVLKMKNKIGYPDFIMDPKKLYEYYEMLEVNENNFNINEINFIKYHQISEFKFIYEPIDRNGWLKPPQTLNAYNKYEFNDIIFPAGIFQSLLYNTLEPDYLNYGGFGSLIGHEMIHSFDNTGRLYDDEGNYNGNWWTNSTIDKYTQLTQCFIDQYDNYFIEDSEGKILRVRGDYTLNENIADNGGIARSYEAWKISLIKNPEKASKRNFILPGLEDYTFDQLFYIAHGQFLCSLEKPDYIKNMIEENEHSPYKFRVQGDVSNSEYFAKAFNCPAKSAMNPENKCVIW